MNSEDEVFQHPECFCWAHNEPNPIKRGRVGAYCHLCGAFGDFPLHWNMIQPDRQVASWEFVPLAEKLEQVQP